MNSELLKLCQYLKISPAKDLVREISLCKKTNELTLISTRDRILALLEFLRDDPRCCFEMLIDICAVDKILLQSNGGGAVSDRFEIVYNMLSVKLKNRIRVKVDVPEGGGVSSVTGLFAGADWYEREAWDMYGIIFDGHPNLVRILTDYDFKDGHPLRKDFPLGGYTEVRYDDGLRCVKQKVRKNFDEE